MGEQTSGVETSHRSKFVTGIISHFLARYTRAHTNETITFNGLWL